MTAAADSDAPLDAAVRDAARPDAASLEAASRDAGRPDAASLEAASRDAGRPDAASLDAASRDAGRPDAASLDAAVRDAARLDAASLEAASLDAASLDTAQLDAVLRAANVLLGVAARSVLDVEDEVTSVQLRVLVLIAATGSRTPGDIAVALGVHPSNATRTCDKLVRAGLAERTGNPHDRRSVRLVLTPAGSTLVERVITRRRSALAGVLAAMPARSRAATAAAFAAFARTAQSTAAGADPADDGRFTLLLPGRERDERPGAKARPGAAD